MIPSFPSGPGRIVAPLGKGHIGQGPFHNHQLPHLKHLPFLLETPTKDYREYADEIVLLRSLVN